LFRQILKIITCFLVLLTIAGILSGLSGCDNSQSSQARTPPQASGAVRVVIVGVINHEPLKETVDKIKEVLAKYGDKLDITWIDSDTVYGGVYAATNDLKAHMNIVINDQCTCKVNDKDITFQGFEGGQWTMQDLDAVLVSLVGK
jgi:hypothetical protein